VFTILGGLIQTVIKPNVLQFMEEVADGKLDYVLAKPVCHPGRSATPRGNAAQLRILPVQGRCQGI
jgi:ABC-2 family transporter protein